MKLFVEEWFQSAWKSVIVRGKVSSCLYSFSAANALEMLILRNTETVCTLGADGLYYTKIHSGQGYVYVPAALVDSYKETACWKYEVDQIRAIEDYPEITGGES